jgi:hypothetical protein
MAFRKVTWAKTTGGLTATSTGIKKASGTTGWNADAVSKEFIDTTVNSYGEICCTPVNNGGTQAIMFGLDYADNTVSYTDALNLYFCSGSVYIYEIGVYRGNFGVIDYNAVYSIHITDTGLITYRKNGTTFYTSPNVIPKTRMYIDVSACYVNNEIKDVGICTDVVQNVSGTKVIIIDGDKSDDEWKLYRDLFEYTYDAVFEHGVSMQSDRIFAATVYKDIMFQYQSYERGLMSIQHKSPWRNLTNITRISDADIEYCFDCLSSSSTDLFIFLLCKLNDSKLNIGQVDMSYSTFNGLLDAYIDGAAGRDVGIVTLWESNNFISTLTATKSSDKAICVAGRSEPAFIEYKTKSSFYQKMIEDFVVSGYSLGTAYTNAYSYINSLSSDAQDPYISNQNLANSLSL